MLSYLAAALLYLPPQAVPATPEQLQTIPMVDCIASRGTAFRIGPNLLLSVNHVTKEQGCFINSKPFTISYSSPKLDFSILTTTDTGPFLKIDCGGFVKGHKYVAIGHARGLYDLTSIEGVATGTKDGARSILWGIFTVIPGQSGGPILDEDTGKVVGTVNTFDPFSGESGSVALKDTPLCGATA